MAPPTHRQPHLARTTATDITPLRVAHRRRCAPRGYSPRYEPRWLAPGATLPRHQPLRGRQRLSAPYPRRCSSAAPPQHGLRRAEPSDSPSQCSAPTLGRCLHRSPLMPLQGARQHCRHPLSILLGCLSTLYSSAVHFCRCTFSHNNFSGSTGRRSSLGCPMVTMHSTI